MQQLHTHANLLYSLCYFFFSSRRRHTRWTGDWSSDVCSSDLRLTGGRRQGTPKPQVRAGWLGRGDQGTHTHTKAEPPRARSEERRVGKECRSRGSPYH